MSTSGAFWQLREIFVSFDLAIRAQSAINYALASLFAACIVCGSTQLAHANVPSGTIHKRLKPATLAPSEKTCFLTKNNSDILNLASLNTTQPKSNLFGMAHSTVEVLSKLSFAITAYRSRFTSLTAAALKKAKLAIGKTIVGTASTYNPHRPNDKTAGGIETASGEPYSAKTWTAAIKTNLRDKFGGVRYGKNYQPAYALVEGANKGVIVKINDVGPLKPDRIIDFNERTMRYFDPTLELGLIRNVRVTPLPGDGWKPGPIEEERVVSFATKLEKLASTAQ